jgi:hypothetical protein
MNWLILHNRFVVERGQGVYAGTTSFDHIIQGNFYSRAKIRSMRCAKSRAVATSAAWLPGCSEVAQPE